MKIRVTILEVGSSYNSFSVWGSDSGGMGGIAKAGDEYIAEGANVSVAGSDGVGINPVGSADTQVQ